MICQILHSSSCQYIRSIRTLNSLSGTTPWISHWCHWPGMYIAASSQSLGASWHEARVEQCVRHDPTDPTTRIYHHPSLPPLLTSLSSRRSFPRSCMCRNLVCLCSPLKKSVFSCTRLNLTWVHFDHIYSFPLNISIKVTIDKKKGPLYSQCLTLDKKCISRITSKSKLIGIISESKVGLISHRP